MLKVKTGARGADRTALMVEGEHHNNGGVYTRELIEKVANLPVDYTVGTVTKDQNFWYKVLEV